MGRVPSRDRLSCLPDELLQEILSHLPLDAAARSAAISRRWRHLWASNPVLHLSPVSSLTLSHLPSNAYVRAVDHCLRLCSPTRTFRSLSFSLDFWPHLPAVFDRWISFAAARSVASLSVRGSVFGPLWSFVDTPPSLFRCRSLVSLRLSHCTLANLPPTPAAADWGFPLLKTLTLRCAVEDDQLAAMLAACPRIETLCLAGCSRLERLVVDSLTLQSLEVHEDSAAGSLEWLVIKRAPLLWRFAIKCSISTKIRNLKAAPSLRQVALFNKWPRAFEYQHQLRHFALGLGHVEVLSVNHWFVQFMLSEDSDANCRQAMLPNVKELHYCGELFDWCNLRVLATNLRECPSLEKLFLHKNYTAGNSVEHIPIAGNGSSVDDSSEIERFEGLANSLPRLNKMVISEFSGEEGEMRFVEFVLNQAVSLENVVVYYASDTNKKRLDEICNKVQLFQPASPAVQTSFLEVPCGYDCRVHEWQN